MNDFVVLSSQEKWYDELHCLFKRKTVKWYVRVEYGDEKNARDLEESGKDFKNT